MSYTIAITGKGGVGKTTLAGLIIARLIARGSHPVLAVDADPNVCLADVLGERCEKTIGGVREEAREIAAQGMKAGISKQDLLELKIAESLVEADCFDLISMGRPEGPGCYCYANNVLKQAIGQIADSYPYVVIDNEAGLENLSRRIVTKANLLVVVADPSKRGLDTAARLHALAAEMEIEYDRLAILVNRMRREEPSAYATEIQAATQADLLLALPENDTLAEIAERGGSLLDAPDDNPVVQVIDRLLDTMLPKNG